jgi:DNA-binding XRE family transcriptional regulator
MEMDMAVQVILRDGMPDYAVLPWDEYQALRRAADQAQQSVASEVEQEPPALPSIADLQALREQQNLTQEQLARSVGISPAYLAMIEKGERDPDAAIRRSLAHTLGQPGWSDIP